MITTLTESLASFICVCFLLSKLRSEVGISQYLYLGIFAAVYCFL